ncbi:MAG: hypothetical protein AAF244_02855 [Pseudomonadota bacterium]
MNKNAQNGNAIVIVFVAIALFAALTLAFNNSSRNSSNFVVDSAIDSYAGQIIQLLSQNRSAARKLELRNCDPTDISYEGAEGDFDYSPFATSVPEKCGLFNSTGGGLNYQTPPNMALDSTHSNEEEYGHVLYVSDMQVEGVGDYSISAIIPYLTYDVCLKINEKLYEESSIPEDRDNNFAVSIYRAGETITVGDPFTCETTHFSEDGSECADRIGCFRARSFSDVQDVYVAIQLMTQDKP